MALIRCAGSGSQPTETTLYTATSGSSQSSLTCNLSESMENFDFIKFTFIETQGSSNQKYCLVPSADFIAAGQVGNNDGYTSFTSPVVRKTNITYIRTLTATSATVVTVGRNVQVHGSGDLDAYNMLVNIVGVKY